MSRRHKEQETENNYKPRQAESQADGSQKNSRWTSSSTSVLDKLFTVTKRDKGASRFLSEKIFNAIESVFTKALIDKKIVVDDEWVKIPRSYFEDAPLKLQVDDDVVEQVTHGRGRRFLNRLINTVADSKIVGYVKESYQAVKEKCVELYENTTQFATCCLKALFRTFAPDDDPYGKLSHYHSLIEHELPGLKGRKQLLYNIFHPCATESLRFSFSRLLCAMLIFLCSKVFSSSPTLVSSNGFLLTTMV